VPNKYHALIPARGGSVGILKKNLAEIGGKSLVARKVISAINCAEIDRIFVSSDDQDTLIEARKFGAIGLKRNYEASTNSATAYEMVFDFLSNELGCTLPARDYIIYLQPTSPFCNSQHLAEAIEISKMNPTRSVVSINKVHSPFEKLVKIQDGFLESVVHGDLSIAANRQDLTEIYSPNGAIYIFQIRYFLNFESFPVIGSLPYVMSTIDSIDIDSSADLKLARIIEESRIYGD